MSYIIFLITIQAPFLYLVWKLFDKQSSKINKNLQILKKQNEHIANFMDTLRMSVEKISEDIYGQNGKINSRLSKNEKDNKDMKKRFQELEIYTGLNTGGTIPEINSSSVLKGKNFS